MTVRVFLPELQCERCGHKGNDYEVKENGLHHTVYCANCQSYIKNLSKEDKYGTREQQLEIWSKTGCLCCYCGQVLNPYERNGFTYEHIEPRIKGGGNETENLYLCCKSCNSQKGGKTLAEYRAYIKKITGKPIHVFHFEVLEYGPRHISEILKALTIGNTINTNNNDR